METKHDKFIGKLKKANIKFNYDYTNTVYGNRLDKVNVYCNLHGPFAKSVQQLERGLGCPSCIKTRQKENRKQLFINKATEVHSGKYTYSKVDYSTNKSLTVITCKKHGDFEQSPDNHLAGHGCKKCQYETVKRKNSKTSKTFIEEATLVHGNKYDYSLVEYKNSDTKVKIILPSGEVAEQLPSHHLQGFRPSTEPRGLDYSRAGILYYLKVTTSDLVLYKIGITTETVQERFNVNDLKCIELLYQKSYKTVKQAFIVEQKILKQYKDFQYKGNPILRSNGNTELFTLDIFKGNYNEINSMGK